MKNKEWCIYTYKHRLAFKYVAERLIKNDELLEEILKRRLTHDLDKQLMYLFLEWDECIEYHITHRPHHLECPGEKSYEDLVEMVIDFECSPYTKPDKPLNAFDFVTLLKNNNQIESETAERLFDIMHDLEIDKSYDVTKEEQCVRFLNSIPHVTEEMILSEVRDYIESGVKEEMAFILKKLIQG